MQSIETNVERTQENPIALSVAASRGLIKHPGMASSAEFETVPALRKDGPVAVPWRTSPHSTDLLDKAMISPSRHALLNQAFPSQHPFKLFL